MLFSQIARNLLNEFHWGIELCISSHYIFNTLNTIVVHFKLPVVVTQQATLLL